MLRTYRGAARVNEKPKSMPTWASCSNSCMMYVKPSPAPPQTLKNRGPGPPWEPKCTQEAPKSSPKAPRSAQETAKKRPRAAKRRPRAAKRCPRRAQEAPEPLQKRVPRGPQAQMYQFYDRSARRSVRQALQARFLVKCRAWRNSADLEFIAPVDVFNGFSRIDVFRAMSV